jgi:hypothetical protein
MTSVLAIVRREGVSKKIKYKKVTGLMKNTGRKAKNKPMINLTLTEASTKSKAEKKNITKQAMIK